MYKLTFATSNHAIVHVDSKHRKVVHVERDGDECCADYTLSSRYAFIVRILTQDGLTICRIRAHSVGEQMHLDL